jgi:hypothetical protein
MRGIECGTSRKRITDITSFPFCRLAHCNLSALPSNISIPISQRDDNEAEPNQYKRQQHDMTYDINENIIAKGTRNGLSKLHQPINESLTGRLQRYVFFGYQRNKRHLNLNTNNTLLQIMSRESNCDFHEQAGSSPNVPVRLCHRNNLSFKQWTSSGEATYWKSKLDEKN